MKSENSIDVILVDSSLFTAPYDAALTEGLIAVGAEVRWAVRPLRDGDRQEIRKECCDPFFYRWIEKIDFLPNFLWKILKGIAHLWGLLLLLSKVIVSRPDVVHFQWLVIPYIDTAFIRIIKIICPVVITVHDTTPFNGDKLSLAQKFGFDAPLKIANKLIVHTFSAKKVLMGRGIDDKKISVIPHGPLSLHVPIPITPIERRDKRVTFVMFGEIKPYKGLDILIEAVEEMQSEIRSNTRFIVAGRPRMDLSEIYRFIREKKISQFFDIREGRLSEEEMAILFDEADCFVFPYRQIDASGVYFLVKGLGKKIIASRVGIFAEDIVEDGFNILINKENRAELRHALEEVASKPTDCDYKNSKNIGWEDIGRMTVNLYLSCKELA